LIVALTTTSRPIHSLAAPDRTSFAPPTQSHICPRATSTAATSWRHTNTFDVIVIIIFKPTSTKRQAEKLGWKYKIMVATAIYSVTMVL